MSSDLIESRLSQISERIRKGRENRHLTLVEVSQRSGVAPSTIQKIENRQMTPSIAVIIKIAEGLCLDAGDLIAPPDPSPLDTLLQRAGQHATIVISKHQKLEKLSAEILGSELECWRHVIAAGHRWKLSVPQKLYEMLFICERGEIELEFAREKVYRLHSGDTLHCRSQVIHRMANPGNVEVAVILSGRFYSSPRAAFTAELHDDLLAPGTRSQRVNHPKPPSYEEGKIGERAARRNRVRSKR